MSGNSAQRTVFVGSLAETTTETSLKAYFGSFGKILRAKLITDTGGNSKQCALIFCKDDKTCKKILRKFDHQIDGKEVRVSPADDTKKSTKCFIENTLFIGNIHFNTTEKELWDYFKSFGEIINLKIFSISKQAHTLNCIINFRSNKTIETIMNSSNRHKLRNRRLRCSLYKPKNPLTTERDSEFKGDEFYQEGYDDNQFNDWPDEKEDNQLMDDQKQEFSTNSMYLNKSAMKRIKEQPQDERFESTSSQSSGRQNSGNYLQEPEEELILDRDVAYEKPFRPSYSIHVVKWHHIANPPFPPPVVRDPPPVRDKTIQQVVTYSNDDAFSWEPGDDFTQNCFSGNHQQQPMATNYCSQFVHAIEYEKDPLFDAFYGDDFGNPRRSSNQIRNGYHNQKWTDRAKVTRYY